MKFVERLAKTVPELPDKPDKLPGFAHVRQTAAAIMRDLRYFYETMVAVYDYREQAFRLVSFISLS